MYCNLEELPKTRDRTYLELMSQVSEQENPSEVEVVLSAARFHDGVHDGAHLVPCGIGRSRAKRKGEGEGERARGEEHRLRCLRRVPKWPSRGNRDVFDLSDQLRQRHQFRVQDGECSHPGRAKFRDATYCDRGCPALRV